VPLLEGLANFPNNPLLRNTAILIFGCTPYRGKREASPLPYSLLHGAIYATNALRSISVPSGLVLRKSLAKLTSNVVPSPTVFHAGGD